MAIRTKAALKAFFNTGDLPTEEEFSDLIDSLRHIQQNIAVDEVDGLTNILNGLATSAQLTAAVPPKLTASINANTTISFAAPGLLREIILQSGEDCTCIIRKNGVVESQVTMEVPALYPVALVLSMPVYNGAILEILSPTSTITYTIYQA